MITPRSERRPDRLALAAIVALTFMSALSARTSGAQIVVQLTLSGPAGLFPTPTPSDFSAGTLGAAGPLTFQVATTSEPSRLFVTTVSVRGSSSTLGGGKPIADLQWRRGDDPTWHALTIVDAIIESRAAQGAPQGHVWDDTIYIRVALRWTTDAPAAYGGNMVLTVSTTTP
jgi:hypothetical protein